MFQKSVHNFSVEICTAPMMAMKYQQLIILNKIKYKYYDVYPQLLLFF